MSEAMRKIRWGILGAGRIAGVFATGLAALEDAELVAVGSRTAEGAAAFAERYNIPRRHTGYAGLVHDSEVDVIYVATPHVYHKEHSLLCLEAGKPVLCEKPITINAGEAEALVAYARARKLFLMEAMWTRFLPHMVRVRELVEQGAIGEVRMLKADFSFRTGFNPQGRLFDPALGGGALLDVGVYDVALASQLFGSPALITSAAHLGTTGVDEQTAILFAYDGGQLAVLTAATRTDMPHEALIAGTTGRIHIHHPWWAPSRLTLVRPGQPDQPIEAPAQGNGYNYEAAEVMRCLRAGLTESPIMPLDESLTIMRTLDAIRAQWGLRYPGETEDRR